MAQLTILQFPDPRLRQRAEPITAVDAALQSLIEEMFETMYEAPGIGLAATQINVHRRLAVIDVSEERNQPLVFINPEVVERQGSTATEEGCLSLPGIVDTVTRAETVTVRAQNRHGEPFELTAEGLLAVCIQHEIDHLDGKLFIDYLSPLKRERIRKKLEKRQRGDHRNR